MNPGNTDQAVINQYMQTCAQLQHQGFVLRAENDQLRAENASLQARLDTQGDPGADADEPEAPKRKGRPARAEAA